VTESRKQEAGCRSRRQKAEGRRQKAEKLIKQSQIFHFSFFISLFSLEDARGTGRQWKLANEKWKIRFLPSAFCRLPPAS